MRFSFSFLWSLFSRNLIIEKELLVACEEGNLWKVRLLLLTNDKINVNTRDENYFDWTPLMNACYYGYVSIVKLLLKDPRIDINLRNKYNETAFYIACDNGRLEIVKLMLSKPNLDINQANNNGVTPLMVVCQNRNLESDKGTFSFHWTPFILASHRKNYEIAELLLNNKVVDLNFINKYGQTAFYIACEYKRIEIVKLMLKNENLDPNIGNHYGRTPLMVACNNHALDVVEWMLCSQHTITIDAQDSDGKTSIDIARERNENHIVELLESFQRNPELTKFQLRKQLGLLRNTFFFLSL